MSLVSLEPSLVLLILIYNFLDKSKVNVKSGFAMKLITACGRCFQKLDWFHVRCRNFGNKSHSLKKLILFKLFIKKLILFKLFIKKSQ